MSNPNRPLEDILATEQYIKDNLSQACGELVELYDGGVLPHDGVVVQARQKLAWLYSNAEVVSDMINTAAVRKVCGEKP